MKKYIREILNDLKLAPGQKKLKSAVPTDLDNQTLSKDMDIIMLTYPGGQERTEAQFRSLLQASGFELQSITPTTSMVSVVEGKPV